MKGTATEAKTEAKIKALEAKFRHEILDDDARLQLLETIKRLKK